MSNFAPITSSNNLPATKASKSKLPLFLLLAVVAIAGGAAIGISLRQFFVREPVAPTAPVLSQAKIEPIKECSLSFDVAVPLSGINCVKKSYRDELSNSAAKYELLAEKSTFKPGETVVYSFEVKNTGETMTTITATDIIKVTGASSFNYTFLDSNCGTGAYNTTTKVLTCVAKDLGPTQSKIFTFRIKLSDKIADNVTVNNTVNLSNGTLANNCSVDLKIEVPTTTPTPTPVACNETCASNSDCKNSDQICYFKQCRLATYPDRADCSVPTTTPTPTPTPTPAVTCNQNCTLNRDCTAANHICFSGKCRLESNPESATCNLPVTVGQPQLPQELPKSGSEDIINWIKAGVGILGAGVLLLLL